MAKKRNPNDSTFRNITALKKRVKLLEQKFAALDSLKFYQSGETLHAFFQRKGIGR